MHPCMCKHLVPIDILLVPANNTIMQWRIRSSQSATSSTNSLKKLNQNDGKCSHLINISRVSSAYDWNKFSMAHNRSQLEVYVLDSSNWYRNLSKNILKCGELKLVKNKENAVDCKYMYSSGGSRISHGGRGPIGGVRGPLMWELFGKNKCENKRIGSCMGGVRPARPLPRSTNV